MDISPCTFGIKTSEKTLYYFCYTDMYKFKGDPTHPNRFVEPSGTEMYENGGQMHCYTCYLY